MRTIGQYQLLEELGRGAMGVVFRGYDPVIGRAIAIKIIRTPHFATPSETVELKLRFDREAEAAGRLCHPNIVTIYQKGEQDGIDFIAMEFVDGSALDKVISDKGIHEITAVIGILGQVAHALDYAHGEGVVHRDIKPANILLQLSGRAKVTDFGVARIVSQTLTRSGMTMGTPGYMAPEQVRGSKVEGPADQFSLGVIAYQMLTGKMPFDGASAEAIMYKIASEEPAALHEINRSLSPVISEAVTRALAKTPEHRYSNCREFIEALAMSTSAKVLNGVKGPSINGVGAVKSIRDRFTHEVPKHKADTPLSRKPFLYKMLGVFGSLSALSVIVFSSRGPNWTARYSSAKAQVNQIQAAQAAYLRQHGGFATTLLQLRAAGLLPEDLVQGDGSGYEINMRTSLTGYSIDALPADPKAKSDRALIIHEGYDSEINSDAEALSLKPIEKTAPVTADIWRGNLAAEGRFISDGRRIIIDSTYVNDNQVVQLRTRGVGSATTQSTIQRVFDRAVTQATEPLQLLGKLKNAAFFEGKGDLFVIAPADQTEWLMRTEDFTSARGSKDKSKIVFYSADQPAAVLSAYDPSTLPVISRNATGKLGIH